MLQQTSAYKRASGSSAPLIPTRLHPVSLSSVSRTINRLLPPFVLALGLVALALLSFSWPADELPANPTLTTTTTAHGKVASPQHAIQTAPATPQPVRLLVASHGRLLWFTPATGAIDVLHKDGGVHYGMFPGRVSNGVMQSVWFVSRPHNWRAQTSEEDLIELDARDGTQLSRKGIQSRFSHDAVRSGSRVYVCSTESGEILELIYPTMEQVRRMHLFTLKHHVNTLTPMGDGTMWAMLHNLGKSKMVHISLGDSQNNEPHVIGDIPTVGTQAHGLVTWREWFVLLDSQTGALVRVPRSAERAVPSMSESDSMSVGEPDNGREVVYQVPEGHTKFLKGLCVLGDTAFFGINDASHRQFRDDPDLSADIAAVNLHTGKLLWRKQVATHGLLNTIGAPHISETSTYHAQPIQLSPDALHILPPATHATHTDTHTTTTTTSNTGAGATQTDLDSAIKAVLAAGRKELSRTVVANADLTHAITHMRHNLDKAREEREARGETGEETDNTSNSQGASNATTGDSINSNDGNSNGEANSQGSSEGGGVGGGGGESGGDGDGKTSTNSEGPGVALGISDPRVQRVTRQLEEMGFPPKISGHWPTQAPYLDLPTKRGYKSWEAGIQLPLMQVDVAEVKAVMESLGSEVWSDDYQKEHNAAVAGRDANMNKFKPGVGALYLIFSDRTIDNAFLYPFYDKFKAVLEPLLHKIQGTAICETGVAYSGAWDAAKQIIGVSSMRKIVRLQFAKMPPNSVIHIHRDMGGYAAQAHRIHVPVSTNPDVVFESCPGFERRAKGMHAEVRDHHTTEPGDCVALPMEEGMVFELNNRILHRVYNHSPNTSRIQMVVDVAEVDKPLFRLKPGTECQYVMGKVECPKDSITRIA